MWLPHLQGQTLWLCQQQQWTANACVFTLHIYWAYWSLPLIWASTNPMGGCIGVNVSVLSIGEHVQPTSSILMAFMGVTTNSESSCPADANYCWEGCWNVSVNRLFARLPRDSWTTEMGLISLMNIPNQTREKKHRQSFMISCPHWGLNHPSCVMTATVAICVCVSFIYWAYGVFIQYGSPLSWQVSPRGCMSLLVNISS